MEQGFQERVFAGNDLHDECLYNDPNAKFGLVGETRRGPGVIPVGRDMLSHHILLLGGIGTGKTNTFDFLISNIRQTLTADDLMIIFDTKGDYYREFYQPGDVVISNDERASGGSGPDYWNIFNEITADDRIEENVLEISKSLFADKLEHSSQPFFPTAAKDLFSALVLHMLRDDAMAGARNNLDLRSIFDSFSVPAMKNILAKYKDLKAMASYIEDEKSGQTQGVTAELQQLTREIFVGNFKKRGTLSLRQLVRQKGGRVVFIEYDLGLGNVLTPIYRLLIDLAIKEALCRKKDEGSVYFLIDEFRLLPLLQHMDDGVNFGRSLGTKFAIGIQNIEQIEHAYGKDLAQSILSGFSTIFAFRVNDAISREYIKDLFGKNIKMQTYVSSVQSRGLSEQTREGCVVEDADVTNLQVGEAVVGTMSNPPFRFRFKRYPEKQGA